MSERPEWVKCIEHDRADLRGTSWCGRTLPAYEWRFTDLSHTAYNGAGGGRTVACGACIEAATAALRVGA